MSTAFTDKLRAALWWAAMGALVLGGGAMLLAPRIIDWYFRPPAPMGFSCSEPIRWALNKLQDAGILGASVGALVGLGLYFAVIHRRARTERPLPA